MAKFEIAVTGKHDTDKYIMSCELKDYLYHKLLERIDSHSHIMDNKKLENLAEKYREEIEMILHKVKVI